jgi:hypothetical protein
MVGLWKSQRVESEDAIQGEEQGKPSSFGPVASHLPLHTYCRVQLYLTARGVPSVTGEQRESVENAAMPSQQLEGGEDRV